MEELLRTNDIVLISFVESLLKEAGITHFVADQNMSVIEGSLGAGLSVGEGGLLTSLDRVAISGGAVLAPAAFLFMAGMFAGGIPTAWAWHRGSRGEGEG